MVLNKKSGRSFIGLSKFLAGVAVGLLMTSALAVAQEDKAPAEDAQEQIAAADEQKDDGASSEALEAKISALEKELARARSKCGAGDDGQGQPSDGEREELSRRIRQMKPDAAARLLATLELELAVDIFRRLDDRSSARILNKMPVTSATRIVSTMAGESPAEPTPTSPVAAKAPAENTKE